MASSYQAKNDTVKKTFNKTRRLAGMIYIVILIFLSFIGETFRVSVYKHQYYSALAKDQQIVIADIAPKRGIIYLSDLVSDNGKAIIAESVERFALAVTPKNVPKDLHNKIAAILDPYVDEKNRVEIIKVFEKNSLYAPPLQHGLTQQEVEELARKVAPKIKLNFNVESGNIIYFTHGIMFLREFYRFYPEDNLASQIIGFVNYQGEGKYGIEDFYDNELKGAGGSVALEKDNQGELLQEVGLIQRKDGEDLNLTIDKNIQYFVEKRLARALQDYEAESGTVIIMKPKTGAIIAMSSLPDYNLNNFSKTEYEKFLNPAVNSQYEAGSVMKPFTIAAALDLGVVTKEMKNDFPSSVTIGSYTINNVAEKSYPKSDITGILDNSINTGTVWLADKLGNEHFYNYLKNFGFGAKTEIDLPGEIEGTLPELKRWRDIHRATISFGQGDAVTPIQLITGYNAIANNGVLVKPYLVQKENDSQKSEGKKVINEITAKDLRKMLQHVVEYGHAKHAQVSGYSIGGKTGTAQIPQADGGYSETETIQTFAGMGPVESPRFVMTVILHKPKKAEFADSSTVYVFSDIAKFLLNYWQVPPDKK